MDGFVSQIPPFGHPDVLFCLLVILSSKTNQTQTQSWFPADPGEADTSAPDTVRSAMGAERARFTERSDRFRQQFPPAGPP